MNSYLLAFDFDGTIARTFNPSLQGIGINEAYELAIADVFGKEGLSVYQSLDGLRNRAPSELATLLLEKGSKSMVDSAHRFFLENHNKLDTLVPQDKSIPLIWDKDNTKEIITELLVRQKLTYLLDQIGTRFKDGQIWPKPCQGFMGYWLVIQELKEQGINITTAIISSGHEAFIRKTFKTWSLKQPDILVTEDDIRGRKYPAELERRVKPGVLPLALAHFEWLKTLGFDVNNFDLNTARELRSRIVYFGDDPVKDGYMAGERVVFGLFNENGKPITESTGNSFCFADWTDITQILKNNNTAFREGKPFQDIFLGQNHQVESLISTGSPEKR